MNKYVISKITDEVKYYIFLDEIQHVKNFEKVLTSFRATLNCSNGQETIDREFGAFKPIADAAPKYVLSLDRIDYSRNGVCHLNIVDFLLGKKEIVLI